MRKKGQLNKLPYYKQGKAVGVGPIGERLKAERIRRRWKLCAFADAIGAVQSQVTAWENRGVTPSLRYIIKCAQVLECSIDWLVGLED